MHFCTFPIEMTRMCQPAPPGCHSIQTTTCHKVPHRNSTKIPYEICSSIKCDMVLTEVTELDCKPVVEEECNDFVKEIPFLVGDEECEEVFFDECYEVIIPIFINQLRKSFSD